MDDIQFSSGASNYTMRLEQTLRTLQDRVAEQEAVLAELRESSAPIEVEPSSDPTVNLIQLRLLAAAYRSITSIKLYLPPRESLLPILLALSITSKTIQETLSAISETEDSIERAKNRVEEETADLEDAERIRIKVLARIATLNDDIKTQAQKSPTDQSRDLIRTLEDKKKYYDNETTKLSIAFDAFIDDYLAPMLALEDLGGPIVSQIMEVDKDMLESKQTRQGKAKRVKMASNKQQKRIDKIWDTGSMENDECDVREAAATEIKQLTEKLLDNIPNVDGHGPAAYVELERESAAARFLIRSNIAQSHPRDASKLRLVDFGGKID